MRVQLICMGGYFDYAMQICAIILAVFPFLVAGLHAAPAGEGDEALLARGNAAAAALFGQLMATVQSKVQSDGVEGAIAFCQVEALPLTDQTAAALEGVKSLRRVGVRTRNPANEPDALDREVLQEFLRDWSAVNPPAPQLRRAQSASGEKEIRFYRPIPVIVSCLACHGDKQAMAPNVLAAIASRYPQDGATGFAEGDLRGAIVVTFPNVSSESE